MCTNGTGSTKLLTGCTRFQRAFLQHCSALTLYGLSFARARVCVCVYRVAVRS